MKKLYLVTLLIMQLALATKTNGQNVAINATASLPDNSAMLDVSSSDKGFLAPRLTTTQQNAISLPATGLLIFNTTDNVFKVNTGTPAVPLWTPLALGSGVAISSLNGLTGTSQTFATGTTGTDFGISSSGTAHTFNLPTASASNRGALSSADWTAFNSKQGALTLTTTGTSGAATLVGNTLNIPSYNAASTAWSLTGNAATAGSQFLGSTNNVSLRMRTNNIERMVVDSMGKVGIGTTAPAEALSVTGNIALTTPGNKFIGNTGLTFEQNGDIYGTTRLSIQNRNAVNGAMFEQAGTVDLVDFVFKGLTNQRNIRYENRATYSYIGYPAPEFQIGIAGDPTLVVSDNAAAFRKGFLSIGMNNASALLHIKGGTAAAGTAPLKINAGTNLTTPEDGAVEYNGNHFYGTIGSTRYQLDQQGGGTVTSASVVNANGFTGSVATATTTPAITLGTSVSGMLKGNGTAISAATAGTDYLTPTGSAAGLTSFPTLNQSTTGNAATVTTNANLTGPITSVGNATSITNNAVTYAKMQAMTTNKLLGSGTGTAVAEITLGTGLSFTGTTLNAATTGGTVTSTSVVSANGFSGTVATPTTTPAITLGTSITGILKGNGTAISAATAGTDYLTPTGSAAGLTSFPTLNQNTTGNSATVTTNANLTGPITSVGNATSIAAQTGTGTTFAMSVSPNFTGVPLAPTASAGTNTTQIATTAFVKTATATNANLTGPITSIGNTTSIASQTGTGTTFAMSVSPTFTGTPTLPTGTIATTQTAGDNTTAVATTAFVTAALAVPELHAGDVTGLQNATVVGKINGVSMAGLATGILKNTTGAGTPSIAVAADFPTLNQNTTGNAATVTTNANLTGPITSVGNATAITNNAVTYAKIQAMTANRLLGSGLAGTAVNEITLGTGLSYTGSTLNATNNGTVTSVAALTLGTTGTDLSSSVASGTTTPVITLNIPTASVSNRGALSSADWTTFNSKQDALTLTTTGTSGAATLVGSTLNIPAYAAASSAWSLNGNSGITQPAVPGTYGTSALGALENFFGTKDAKDLVFATNNIEKMRFVNSTGYLGIGTATPSKPIDLVQSVANGGLMKLQNKAANGYSSIDVWSNTTQIGNIGFSNGGASYPNLFYFATNTSNGMVYATNNTQRMIIDGSTGNIGIGPLFTAASPATASLQIEAGTAAAGTAPLKLTSGTNLTTPEDGAVEYNGSHFYGTVGSTRYQLDQQSAASNMGILVSASRTSTYTIAAGYSTLAYNSATINVGAAYNTGTGIFTAPATGLYEIMFSNNYTTSNAANNYLSARVIVNGSTDIENTLAITPYSGSTNSSLTGSTIVQMNAAQTAYITVGGVVGTITPLFGTMQTTLKIIRLN